MDTNYFKVFWVGLMDGDGSIQVNHWNKKNLQYRFIIKLLNVPENFFMLELLKKHVGGKVTIVNDKKGSWVLWQENYKKNIKKLLNILETFPPNTSRLQMQLEFLIKSMALFESFGRKAVTLVLEQRKEKYKGIETRTLKKTFNKKYFGPWLSGFIEAEGCFSIRKNGCWSFSIGQKGEKALLEKVRNTLYGKNPVRCVKDDFYLWEEGNIQILEIFISFFKENPLLGLKLKSFNNLLLHYK